MSYFEEKVFEGLENELKLFYCGKRIHNFSHSFGPYTRQQYLIYYIKEGSATLQLDGRAMELTSKGFFVNFPNSQTIYHCAENVPWSIKWIVVEGRVIEQYLLLLGITRSNPFMLLRNPREIEAVFDEMFEQFDSHALSAKVYCISLLYKLFSLLADSAVFGQNENAHVQAAQELMEQNYHDSNFNVSHMAQMLGLHHNYLSVLYKKETGFSPISALGDIRLKNACKMLKFTDKPIKEIASLCGFSDELYFSRAFRKKFGVSPSAFRRSEEYLT